MDEGLSNFGIDRDGNIFYLDDDYYRWDDFTSLTNMMFVWVRQLEKMDDSLVECMAEQLIDAVQESFATLQHLKVLHGQFKQVVLVTEREQRLCELVLHKLAQAAFPRYQKTSRESTAIALDETAADAASFKNAFAVVADVHGNLIALEAVLAELKKEVVSQILVLGDVVGYGPQPNECIELLRKHNCIVIQGDHDYACACGDDSRGFSRLASWSVKWTQQQLTEDNKAWLLSLPPILYRDDWVAVHGAPIDKNYFYAYVYHMTYQENLDWLRDKDLHIGFHGHTHLQGCYVRNGSGDQLCEDKAVDVNRYRQMLICPGSVGLPRGGVPKAEYGLFDGSAKQILFRAVDYDVAATAALMQQLQFPLALSERLLQGR